MSQRSCERTFRVSQNTVAKLFEEAGDMAIAYLASIKDLTVETAQADELYSFIAARSFNVKDMAIPTDEAGTIWTYLAVCADTKLIFAYHLGDRGLADATIFARRAASKLKRKPNGEFAVRPTIITDGLYAYPVAMEAAFGSDLNFGVMTKKYSKTDVDGNRLPGSRYQGADRAVKQGDVDPGDFHTSYIERQNLNVRMGNRRYGRRTNAFSKKLVNHERHLALWIMYHNFCWMPRPHRPSSGSADRTWEKRLPAAMAAGLTESLWEIEDLLTLTDAYIAERKLADCPPVEDVETVELLADDTDLELAPSHWVYRSFVPWSAKVHRAGCANCRDGLGKAGRGSTKNGEWLPFYCLEDAEAGARALEPDRYSICNMCLGEYRKLGGGR